MYKELLEKYLKEKQSGDTLFCIDSNGRTALNLFALWLDNLVTKMPNGDSNATEDELLNAVGWAFEWHKEPSDIPFIIWICKQAEKSS